jgi:hypothetical protein
MSIRLFKGAYRLLLPICILAFVAAGSGASASPAGQSGKFADPAFERTWQRTDLPLSKGQVKRTWFWGPQPGAALIESYQNSPDGPVLRHQVQYFDKSRMEINNPGGDRNSPWYVTNGLLTVELIAGDSGIGSPTGSMPPQPAEIPVAADMDDANAPTYRSFRAVADVPGNGGHEAKAAIGQSAIATINRAGQVGSDRTKAALGAPVKYAYYEGNTKHNVVGAFWEFLNSTDLVYENGATKLRLLSDPWFYATGFPVSEAYWARAKIAGETHDVLIQAFQRRVLTYVPDNPAGWRVQMGNIGQHYYQWRYGNGQPQPPAPPAATPSGRIAFASDRAGSGLQIYTVGADGSALRLVAKTQGNNYSPHWSPRGQSIAYVNVAPGITLGPGGTDGPTLPGKSTIMFTSDTANASGVPMGATTVPQWDAQADPAYSPDGTFLVFRGKPSGEQAGLFVANLVSEAIVIPVRRLTTGEWDRQPAWSPDGKQIAFTSGSSADTSQVWVVNADGTGKRRLTADLRGQRDQDPAWRPDGKQLLYVSDGGTGKFDIMTLAPDGTPGSALTGGDTSSQRFPSYSPDGTWISFASNKSGNLDVYVSPADGSRWTNISNSPGIDTQPAWK